MTPIPDGSSGVLLPGSVQSAPEGAIGFDTDSVLTADSSQNFVGAGFSFAIRYLSLGLIEYEGDLSSGEAERILQSGLALMAVQHVRDAGWIPSRGLGREDGQNAAANARAVGLPPGVNIWLDLEGVRFDTPSSDVIEHCNAWFAAVAAAGYVPGLYVGANAVLSSDQVYYDLDVKHYWKSGSEVPSVADRGYCMVQAISDRYVLDGRRYDRNVIQMDNLGNTPVWLAANAQV
jgi:hypothetical protein